MEQDTFLWESGFGYLYADVNMTFQEIRCDDTHSVATLGSFASASWVAEHFAEEESREILIDEVEWTPESQLSRKSRSSLSEQNQIGGSFSSREELCDQTIPNNLEERGFRCPHCGKGFTRRSEMGRHVGVRSQSFFFFFSVLAVTISIFVSQLTLPGTVSWMQHMIQ